LACTAGFENSAGWQNAYQNWGTIQAGLGAKLGAFISGCSRFIEALGVDRNLATAFIAVVVVSFALTTLDSATRLLRFNVSEIGSSLRIKALGNRFLATGLAIAAIAFFAFYKIDGKEAGLVLWTLFGITNQLLAGLALLVATLYLHQRGRNPWFTGLPMVFMLVSTTVALLSKLWEFYKLEQGLLLLVGSVLLLLAAGIVVEGVRAFLGGQHYEDDQIVLAES